MSRRPRGTCPVCRNVLSLCWSGEIRVLRKHAVSAEQCPGSGHPAVGEVPELHLARPEPARSEAARAAAPAARERSAVPEPRVASVA